MSDSILSSLVKFVAMCFALLAFSHCQIANARQLPFIVVDVADGSIIAANRENQRWYPASLTKLMSVYVTMKALEANEIELGSPVRISKNARKMPPSRMGYKIGTVLRVDTALKIVIVKSANDVSVALAEAVSGSVKNFITRMNETAKYLGMNNSNFASPNGLHSANQYTSSRDLAILSRRILLDFPQYADWFAIPAIRTKVKVHYSYNLLLERFSGANGMKTGFVCASGYNMVASATRAGRQLIAIVLGAGSQTERAVLAAKLLTEAFDSPQRVVGNILASADTTKSKPVNRRAALCTEEARKNRYDPGAGKAVLNSPYLDKRKIKQQPLLVSIGGIDGKPTMAYSMQMLVPDRHIPLPSRRPDYMPNKPIDKTWQNENKLTATLPIPLPRPTY